jgi:DNA-binding winged helix-turn-helix (wHTH) protein
MEIINWGAVICLRGLYGIGKGRKLSAFLRTLPQMVKIVELEEPRKLEKPTGKTVVVIQELQEKARWDGAWFLALETWRYQNEDDVMVVITARPEVRWSKNRGIKILLARAKYLECGRLSPRESELVFAEQVRRLKDPRLARYRQVILTTSNGFYGVIKLLCQELVRRQYEGLWVSQKTLVKWMDESGMMNYFWELFERSLSEEELMLIVRYVRGKLPTKRERQSTTWENLLKWGIFWERRGRTHCLADPYLRLVQKLIGASRQKNNYLSENEVTIKRGKVWVGREGVKLTGNEQKVLAVLLAKAGNVVSYEEMAQAIWGENWEAIFSLWAMARLVTRVRGKLLPYGINKRQIVAVRGVGYRILQGVSL